MFETVPMRKIHVLVLEKHVSGLTRALGRMGMVHLIDAAAQSSRRLLDAVDRGEEIRRIEGLLNRCRDLLEFLGVGDTGAVSEGEFPNLESIEALVTRAEAVRLAEETEIGARVDESGLLVHRSEQLAALPEPELHYGVLQNLNHLYIVTGRMTPSAIDGLGSALGDRAIVLNDRNDPSRRGSVMVLTTRRNRWALDSELAKSGFSPFAEADGMTESPSRSREELTGCLAALRAEIDEHKRRVLLLAAEYGDSLGVAAASLRDTLAVLRAQQRFGKAAHLYCISGWIPAAEEERVRAAVDDVTSGTGVLEILRPGEGDAVPAEGEPVPVQYVPNRFLRPFRAIIGNYGAPRYGEIDPSPFVAFSFLLIFGLMFGDVGQGAVLAAGGLWLLKTRNAAARPFRDAGYLFVGCGLSAVVFGFMYGSVFGYENEEFLKPILLKPLHDIGRLLTTAIVVGILFISAAIILNIINKIRARKYFEGIFDRFGVIGILFYWGSLGLGLKAARAGRLTSPEILIVIVLPLALLFIREPLHNLLRRRKLFHDDILTSVLEGAVEVMETVTAFLGNTVSFVRIAGYALSHAALCLAIYSIVAVLKDVRLGSVWSLLVIILGNAMVILMEGLVAMIQDVRLQYYELFSKYFEGDGVAYAPFRLSGKPSERGAPEP